MRYLRGIPSLILYLFIYLPLLRARRPSHPPSSGRHDRTPGPPSALIRRRPSIRDEMRGEVRYEMRGEVRGAKCCLVSRQSTYQSATVGAPGPLRAGAGLEPQLRFRQVPRKCGDPGAYARPVLSASPPRLRAAEPGGDGAFLEGEVPQRDDLHDPPIVGPAVLAAIDVIREDYRRNVSLSECFLRSVEELVFFSATAWAMKG